MRVKQPMAEENQTSAWQRSVPLGVVVRRTPGVTQWAQWVWTPVAVVPGAPEAFWKPMREDGNVMEYLAGVADLTLYRSDVEAYKVSLNMESPSLWVILVPDPIGASPSDWVVGAVTASAYEAQDALDSGENLVEAVPMSEGLAAWVAEFVDLHYDEEPFQKRQRDRARVDRVEDGRGDPRISQATDVYRSPRAQKQRKDH